MRKQPTRKQDKAQKLSWALYQALGSRGNLQGLIYRFKVCDPQESEVKEELRRVVRELDQVINTIRKAHKNIL